ncbi:MAG: hypothetical protein SFY92_01825 [Verrucomicrobiae bacterium]|nr:hypothetical protein [Verrucomicrobiae bacterium]
MFRSFLLILLLLLSFGGSPLRADAGLSQELKKILSQIHRLDLRSWPPSPLPAPVIERDALRYKIVSDRGRVFFTEVLPETPSEVSRIWEQRAPEGMEVYVINGVKQIFWIELHWIDSAQQWDTLHPRAYDFREGERLAAGFLETFGTRTNPETQALLKESFEKLVRYQDPEAVARMTFKPLPYDIQRERENLRSASRKLGEPYGAEDLVEAIYKIQLDLAPARQPDRKVDLANKRNRLMDRLRGKIP